MPQKDLELILTRQLVSYLTTPTFLIDPQQVLIYYNEAAEQVVGHRFEETGELSSAVWMRTFAPVDDEGRPITSERLPLLIAVAERRPAHLSFWYGTPNASRRQIHETAIPLIGQSNRFVGALSMLWEATKP
jgi:PAS domain-containing protein